MNQMNFTVINHDARKRLNISLFEYCLADLIYNLSSNPDAPIKGWCYASKEWLSENLGVTRQHIHRMIDLLIEKGLVEKQEDTKFLRTTNKWYKTAIIKHTQDEADSDGNNMLHGVTKSYTDSNKMLHQDSNKMLHNKDNTNKEIYKEHILATDVAETAIEISPGKQINELIENFKDINPEYERFYKNKTERKCLQEMVDKYGLEKVTNMLKQLPQIVTRPYAPRITSPLTLQRKMGELVLFINQEKGKEVMHGRQQNYGKQAVDARNL